MRPKHPDFDEMWKKYKWVVYDAACRMTFMYPYDTDQLIGSLVLQFNNCLYNFDPKKEKFSTYFNTRIKGRTVQDWLRYESESWAVRYWKNSSDATITREAEVTYATHEQLSRLYMIPERKEDWVDEVIEAFETTERLWEYLTRYMTKRDAYILTQFYKYKIPEHEIGNALKITKQRVNQLKQRAIQQMKDRLKVVESFMRMFQE